MLEKYSPIPQMSGQEKHKCNFIQCSNNANGGLNWSLFKHRAPIVIILTLPISNPLSPARARPRLQGAGRGGQGTSCD